MAADLEKPVAKLLSLVREIKTEALNAEFAAKMESPVKVAHYPITA